MEPVLIVTDPEGVDAAAVASFEMDLAYGTDEQDFEASFSSPALSGGEYVYMDGTAYGGVVDEVVTQSGSTVQTYRGRTWHGVLAGKVIAPDPGADYVTVSGDANECIGWVLARVGLSDLFEARTAASGVAVSGYRFARFVDAYAGLCAMLAASGAKLMLMMRSGTVEVWAEPVRTISGQADTDVMALELTSTHRTVNHLVCAGEGELGKRVRLDLYADAYGNVGETQSLFGVDEIAAYYDYTGADLETLRRDGTKALLEMQTQGAVETEVTGAGDWDVGDVLVARDSRVGRSVTVPIVKKVVRVGGGMLATSYEVGDGTAATRSLNGSTESGGAVYAAGEGIQIVSGVISQEESGVEPGEYGPTHDTVISASFGQTLTIPWESVSETGHVTSAANRSVTLPTVDRITNTQIDSLFA